MPMHAAFAVALDECMDEIARIQREARSRGFTQRPRWPMIVLRSPKGWTGPKEVDGKPVEDTWRAHQVPLAELAKKPGHLKLLEGEYRAAGRERRGRRARDGDAERAPVPRLARRLLAHGTPRLLLVLRGVHPHRRLDVQSARQVVEGDARDPLAPADRVVELL